MPSSKLTKIIESIEGLKDDSLTKFFIYSTMLNMLTHPDTHSFGEAFPKKVSTSIFNVSGAWALPMANNTIKQSVLPSKIDKYCKQFSEFEPGIMSSLTKIYYAYQNKEQLNKEQLNDLYCILEKMKDSLRLVNISRLSRENELFFEAFSRCKTEVQSFLDAAYEAEKKKKICFKDFVFLCLIFAVNFELSMRVPPYYAPVLYGSLNKEQIRSNESHTIMSLWHLVLLALLIYQEIAVTDSFLEYMNTVDRVNDSASEIKTILDDASRRNPRYSEDYSVIMENVIKPTVLKDTVYRRQLPFLQELAVINKQHKDEISKVNQQLSLNN